jgi:hypothetical protein
MRQKEQGDSATPQEGGEYHPRLFPGVMVSSTFKDLKEHRLALIKAIKGQRLADIAMENDSAKPDGDLVDSSLEMVRTSSAYVCLIGYKCGQVPDCERRNPKKLSITELEFNEAQRLKLPTLLFIMGEKHPIPSGDRETDVGTAKLAEFRERAKLMGPDSKVSRIYATFDDIHDFTEQAIQSVAELRRYLDENAKLTIQLPTPLQVSVPGSGKSDPIPRPPELYAEPRYIGSHKFMGRKAQLKVLDEWADAADPYPVLLFDAIGGTGKSILTWAWMNEYAGRKRADWAGRFWYSFYEKGADMGDFCRRAVAYMTERPLEEFRGKKTSELRELLFHQLQARPWLLVLDGLERVLVAYNRIDAAEMRDEEINQPTDHIAQRDPCAAIRPEDDELLRSLAGAAPSKVLITSRLVPRVLLNPASQPIPGVRREPLSGLLSEDAEALLKSCGVIGDSKAIQNYLKSNCDCHPLVIGVLAGLICNYLPDPGNFDAWVDDPDGGGKLDLAELNLVQRQNHILKASIEGLPEGSHRLLSLMALLSEAVDYKVLSALNPFLPPEPEEVEEPNDPRRKSRWESRSEDWKKTALEEYEASLKQRKAYERELAEWRNTSVSIGVARPLAKAIDDLKRRGLLQFDPRDKRYDLHPVVRGVAAGGLKPGEKDAYGQRVVDYFSVQAHDPYEKAETLDDVRDGVHIVRTLLKMGRYQQASDAIMRDLGDCLCFNLEAYPEVLSLLRPFFPQGWDTLPEIVDEKSRSSLANIVANALSVLGELQESLAVHSAVLKILLMQANWSRMRACLHNLSGILNNLNHVVDEDRCQLLALDLADSIGEDEHLFMAR